MALIDNLNAELRNWIFPVLQKLSHKTERQHADSALPRAAGPLIIGLPIEVRDQLEIEAAKRGIAVIELCRSILCVVAEDRLVQAVLDDAAA